MRVLWLLLVACKYFLVCIPKLCLMVIEIKSYSSHDLERVNSLMDSYCLNRLNGKRYWLSVTQADMFVLLVDWIVQTVHNTHLTHLYRIHESERENIAKGFAVFKKCSYDTFFMGCSNGNPFVWLIGRSVGRLVAWSLCWLRF